jgi:hypothetical protein
MIACRAGCEKSIESSGQAAARMAAAMSRVLVGLPCFDGLACAICCSFHLGNVSGHILPFSALIVSFDSLVPLLVEKKIDEICAPWGLKRRIPSRQCTAGRVRLKCRRKGHG